MHGFLLVRGSEVGYVRRGPRGEVVQRDDLVPLVEEPLAQVRAEEPGAAGDDGATAGS